MGEVLDLLQLAYFEEMRRHHPRELHVIAERLDLSLRTVSTFGRRLKEVFFAAETQVQGTALRATEVGVVKLAAETGDRMCVYESGPDATSETLCALVP